MQGYIFPYISGRSSPNKYINKNFWGGSGQDKSIPKFQGGALLWETTVHVLYYAAHLTWWTFLSPPCSSKAIGSVPGRPQDHRMCSRSIWGRAVHPWESREVACRARAPYPVSYQNSTGLYYFSTSMYYFSRGMY